MESWIGTGTKTGRVKQDNGQFMFTWGGELQHT